MKVSVPPPPQSLVCVCVNFCNLYKGSTLHLDSFKSIMILLSLPPTFPGVLFKDLRCLGMCDSLMQWWQTFPASTQTSLVRLSGGWTQSLAVFKRSP